MWSGLLRFASCLGLLSLAGTLWAQPADSLSVSENTYFEVVGPDFRSVSTVDELSSHVADTALHLLATAQNPMPRRILVTLKPPASVDFEGDYQIRLEPRGFVTLHFRWDEGLSLENTLYALTRALLIQYAYSNFGSEAPARMRAWPVSTISSLAYLRLRSAQTITFVDEARERPLPSLGDILWAQLLEVPTASADRSGYWMWAIFKRRMNMPVSTFRAYLTEGLKGGDLLARIEDLFQPRDDDAEPVDIEQWWRVILTEELRVRHEPFEGMTASRNWLDALSDLSGIEGLEQSEAITLRQLWKLRDQPPLRDALSARLEIIRLGLDRVNPAYFNSAQSLGALYETVLEGERSYEFIAALTRFLSDFEDMRRLHEEVIAALVAE